ncbi:histone acetyltransferase type B subunit 2 [Cladophialophora carrionii CBS 160.54]|uniref:Histone acetyltransferase type B subunit 2 n=1 Tax=Cladophialophora carrionii CBS 160.54 TaxID=1279043 RepID=V9DDE1_9EURO|nr:histone acetyltransferase type B subunit 2 [Cladophialophora carrionii CBS 160.54]ETI24716.1 histone acetyltransferase type B subunit 2 [Cladophialophora carrionii CBS 160.54]
MADEDENSSEPPVSEQELNQEDAESEQKIINEEYKTWKKNAPFLYDMILSTALDWPTLTTQWFPDITDAPDANYSKHRLLIGTHTAEGQPNYLEIADVQLPKPKKPDVKDYNEETGEIGGYGGGPSGKNQFEVKFTITQKIDHPGEVNKARYQPQNPNIIATMVTDGRILIWDKTKFSSIPTGTPKPTLELGGHTKEGYGLSWDPHQSGRLATASEDYTVRLWDISQASKSNKLLNESRRYTHHGGIVNDVQFHPILPHLLGTVSDDLTMQLLDLRQPDTTRASAKGENQHRDAINAIAFNGAVETVVATGSADKTIAIWDLRNLKDKLHVLEGHNDSVTTLEWHPFEESVLASSSYDRRIMFWDLAKVGEEQAPEDSEDGPPELLFMHGGHTNRISDFAWNKNSPWVVCSAADDNLIQVWKVADAIVGPDDEDVPMNELEG